MRLPCGFPLAKIGVLFSIATGAAIALVIDVFNTHDVKLARKLYQFLDRGDVLLGDRAFCSYADLVFIKNPGCDAVFRKHQGYNWRKKNEHNPITTQIIYDADRYPKEGTSHFSSLTSWTPNPDEKGQADWAI